MKSATQIVWDISGAPAVERAVPAGGRCYICCSEVERGVPVQDWLGSSFVDQNRARCPTASHVCEACVFVMSRISPVPGRPPKEGKKLGGNWRNYSHCWEAGFGYQNMSKGEKPAVRAFLEREHTGLWFAAIADSGQKHVLPFCTINPPGRRGIVLMDEVRVSVPEDQSLTAMMTDLLTRGTTKEGIATGRHSVGAFDRLGDELLSFEREHGRHRGSPWFSLALWLAQRDEETVQRRMAAEKEAKNAKRASKRKATKPDGRVRAGAAGRVPAQRARKRVEALGTAGDAHAGSGADQRDRGGVRDELLQRPAVGGAQQGKLPGFD